MALTKKVTDPKKKQQYMEMLSNWSTFSLIIDSLSERQLKEAMYVELSGRRRRFFADRIRGRISKQRLIREKRYIYNNTL